MAQCNITIMQMAPWVIAIVALCGLFYQMHNNEKQRKYDKSAFSQTSAGNAMEEAYKLLNDGNNDRVKWITAARALKREDSMAEDVTEKVHQAVLDVQRDLYRGLFNEILGYDNPQKGGAFFYGAPDNIQNIDDAAQYSTQKQDGRPRILNLDERSLKIIWDFAQFPKEDKDLVSDSERFSDVELNKKVNDIIWPGLFKYLIHKKQ